MLLFEQFFNISSRDGGVIVWELLWNWTREGLLWVSFRLFGWYIDWTLHRNAWESSCGRWRRLVHVVTVAFGRSTALSFFRLGFRFLRDRTWRSSFYCRTCHSRITIFNLFEYTQPSIESLLQQILILHLEGVLIC